eukprot:EG_transcript_18224
MADPTGVSFFPRNDWVAPRRASSPAVPPRHPSKGRGHGDPTWSTAAAASITPPEQLRQAVDLEVAIQALQREVAQDRRRLHAATRPRPAQRSPRRQFLYRVRAEAGPPPGSPPAATPDLACSVQDWLHAELLSQLTPLLDHAAATAAALPPRLCVGDLRAEPAALLADVAALTRRLVHTANKLLFCLRGAAGDSAAHPHSADCGLEGLRGAIVDRLRRGPSIPEQRGPVSAHAPPYATTAVGQLPATPDPPPKPTPVLVPEPTENAILSSPSLRPSAPLSASPSASAVPPLRLLPRGSSASSSAWLPPPPAPAPPPVPTSTAAASPPAPTAPPPADASVEASGGPGALA